MLSLTLPESQRLRPYDQPDLDRLPSPSRASSPVPTSGWEVGQGRDSTVGFHQFRPLFEESQLHPME